MVAPCLVGRITGLLVLSGNLELISTKAWQCLQTGNQLGQISADRAAAWSFATCFVHHTHDQIVPALQENAVVQRRFMIFVLLSHVSHTSCCLQGFHLEACDQTVVYLPPIPPFVIVIIHSLVY